MLKNITIGQYYPTGSVIHRLDPRVKLAATILYIIAVFLARGTIATVLVILFPILLACAAKLPLRLVFKSARAIWVLIAITAFCNLFFSKGEVLWGNDWFHITPQGIHSAVFYSLRLVLLVVGASIMTLTTTPTRLTDGLETGLRFFNRIGVPVRDLAMMMTIALRFIPILSMEAQRIKEAQQARGAKFNEGGLVARIRAQLPVLMPLFVSAFQKAQELSMAMDARGYRSGSARTRLHPLTYAWIDYAAYTIVIAAFVVICVLRRFDMALPF